MKHVHFIGICGVAMGGLAIAFKNAGWQVTGSDAGFFPPVSTNLEKHNIEFYPGWHPERVGHPDLVVVGNVASSTNPEWKYVLENKLNYKSYPEVIEEFFVKENSIVCAGTYGKTTTSALLSFILTECGYSPSYMFGGIAVDDFDSASLGNVILNEMKNPVEPRDPSTPLRSAQDDVWSVLEGDEYKSSKWDNGAKFFHYHPIHLLLTDIKWDHADVYPTEQSYFEAFEKLIASIPNNGLIVTSEHVTYNIQYVTNHITYGKNKDCDYQYSEIVQDKNGINFKIMFHDTCYMLHTSLIGDYMAENITGAFAMAHQIGIEPEKIISALAKFAGLKRRLEKRHEGRVTVFDDIAHSPAKAQSVLENLKQIYKSHSQSQSQSQSSIICVFEPNTGNRQSQSEPSYKNAFTTADEVIIPALTKLKTSDALHHWTGIELAEIIKKTHNNVKYIGDDKKLLEYLLNNTKDGDVIVFCGSHGFRGMIDELTSRLSL